MGSFFCFPQNSNRPRKKLTLLWGESKIYTLSFIFIERNDKDLGKLESEFQAELKKEIERRFPGAVVFKIETYVQGFPDLGILYKDKWAILECKKSRTAKKQPNQDYYVNHLNEMSFSRFIFPENKEEVLRDLQRAFES